MMTSTRIYGYTLGDGSAVCSGHYDPEVHGRPGGAEGVTPVYSFEDDGHGLSCDAGDWVFEPEVDLVGE
jgi:hypothetical protein